MLLYIVAMGIRTMGIFADSDNNYNCNYNCSSVCISVCSITIGLVADICSVPLL